MLLVANLGGTGKINMLLIVVIVGYCLIVFVSTFFRVHLLDIVAALEYDGGCFWEELTVTSSS